MRGSRPVSIVSHFLVTLEIKPFLLLNQLGLFSVCIFKRARPALNPIIKMISFPISPHFFFFRSCYLTLMRLLNFLVLESNASKHSRSHSSGSKDRHNSRYSELPDIWTQVFEGNISLDHPLNLPWVTSVQKHNLDSTDISEQ